MDRRNFVIGAACTGALALAEGLRPRRHVSLLQGSGLDPQIPTSFGRWRVELGNDVIAPKVPGTLEDKLYGEIVTHSYHDALEHLPGMMLLIAYGQSQSDLLQLHRPESCYPAVGFSVSQRNSVSIPLPGAAALPSVAMTAVQGERVEDIVYWARLGEYMPQTAGEQRTDRLKTAVEGYIPDGALVRASAVRRGDQAPNHGAVATFLRDMVMAMAPKNRAVLIGKTRGDALGGR
jgi:EpsI family protein